MTDIPPELVKLRDELAFAHSNDGPYRESFEEGFDACYAHLHSQARLEFDEMAAKKESKTDAVQRDTFCDSAFTARHNFVKGARWQFERDRLIAAKLAEALTDAIGMITSEYCSHVEECGVGVKKCYAQRFYQALADYSK